MDSYSKYGQFNKKMIFVLSWSYTMEYVIFRNFLFFAHLQYAAPSTQ
jgi:hypothetical protein